MSYFTNAFNIFIAVFAALFPIVNPLGGAPIFLTFVRSCSPKTREEIARKVGIYGFFLLLGSILVGTQVLVFFGISLPVLRVAGGLIVASVGWNMLHQGEDPAERTADAKVDESAVESQAFYPLTLPLTVGPGSIAAAIALAASHPSTFDTNLMMSLSSLIGAVAGLLAVSLTVYLCFREAPTIERVLGRTGTNVLVRLFAFILLAIGVQIIWLGVHGLVNDVMAH